MTTLAVCAQEYVLGDGDEAALDEANDALLERLAALRTQPSKPVGWALMEDGKPRHVTLSKHAVDAWRRATNGDVRELFLGLQGDHDGE